MKKHPYRSYTVNQATKRVPALLKRNPQTRIIVGLDIAKEVQLATVMGEDKEALTTIRFRSPKQNREFVGLLQGLNLPVEVVLESTGTYGNPLIYTFRRAGFSVFQISTKKVRDACELFDGVPSTHDAKAAMIIGRLHLDKLSFPWKELPEEIRSLKAAARTFERYSKSHQENLGRLEARLAHVWPELTQELSLSKVTLLKVLATYGTPQRVTEHAVEAFKFMQKAGHGYLLDDKIKRIIEGARTSEGAPLSQAEVEELQQLAKDTDELRQRRNKVRKSIEALGQGNESVRNISHVVGELSSAQLLMSVGDPRDYDSPNKLLKAVGLNLKQHSSGKKVGQLSISKRGHSTARAYLYFAAMRLISQCDTTRAWYILRLERNGYKKMKGIVAVMRKLVRAIWRIARTGEAFDGTRLFDVGNLKTILARGELVIPEG